MLYLKGLRYVYQLNIFLYLFMAFMGLSIVAMVVKGPGRWARKKKEDAYAY